MPRDFFKIKASKALAVHKKLVCMVDEIATPIISNINIAIKLSTLSAFLIQCSDKSQVKQLFLK